MERRTTGRLRIALPHKGRLTEDVRTLFADAGLELRAAGDRALVASLGGDFEAIFVRAQDIPEFVADGAADAGVTGWDLVRESERELASVLDLEFGRCRLVVAAREESGIESERYFVAACRPVTIVPVSGAAEIAPHLGIADIVTDLVSTGSTLRVNQLREIATILESTARLITAPNGARAGRNRRIDELVAALESVLRARGQRYVMANVPRAALDQVRRVLPGLNGPTVIDVLNGGDLVAVHAVVAQQAIYRTIADLKSLGGEGILVTRIERVMP
jgi:ATP phosphoribosyltransferase